MAVRQGSGNFRAAGTVEVKVTVLYQNDPERPITDPLPELGGRKWIHRVYTGSICDPEIGSDWFGPNFPKRPRIEETTKRLHFFAWKWPFINKAGYAGWKAYGVDSEAYKKWPTMPEGEVYSGSMAVCFTCRPFAAI